MVNLSIFKSYDIRGIYPLELDKESAYKIGRAFVEHTKAKKIVIGRDMRLSSPILFENLVRGVTCQGADVYNIGEVATECMYFALGSYNYDAGIMITASHNPKEYNGFKMMKRNNNGIDVVRGKDMIDIMERVDSLKPEKQGRVEDIDIWPNYLKHIFSFIDTNKIKPFKIVVDAGNGMAGKIIPFLAEKLPVKIIPLNFNLDGNFPSRPPNPLAENASNEISETIREKRADFGFMFDGDADRIFLIDELGKFIKGDITLLLLARYFLMKNPGMGVAYNLTCSRAVPEFIKKWNGIPIRTPVGFVNVRKGIMENNGIMGGEPTGHYSFRDNFYFDSGFIALLILLQTISSYEKKVSKIIGELCPYINEPEINFKIDDKQSVLERIKQKYTDGKQDYLDGVTVQYDDWWFNVRPSQTEPLLRLRIEADNEKLLKEKKKELVSLIKSRGGVE